MDSIARMRSDINRYTPDETISRWNLTRILYVIVLVMLLEIVNLFDADVQKTPYLLIPSIAIIAAGAIIFPLWLYALRRFDDIPLKIKKRMYLYFWMFLPTIVAFSFFIRDAASDRPPLNLLIIIGLISMVPVLNVRETVHVFILPAIVNLCVYAKVSGNVTYMFYSLIFCLAGVMVTVIVHRQYIFMIKELNYRMLHDSLTHLLCRQAGMDQAELLLSVCAREKRPFAAMMIDVDHFKAYNDQKGHPYGDEVLRKVAQAIKDSFLRGDDVVFRYGGEEFCACVSASREGVEEIVKRLADKIRALEIPSEIKSEGAYLTVSLGAAVCESADAPLEDLLKRADEKLYASKEAGRNRATVE